MSQPAGRPERSLADRLPLVEGGLLGGLAFIAAVVVTFLLAQLDDGLGDRIDQLTGAGIEFVEIDTGISTLDTVIWAVFEAHLVDIETTVEGGGQSGTSTLELLSEASLPELLYTVVIAAILVGAGYLLVQRAGARTEGEGALYGATIAVGYLPVAVGTLFLARASESSTVFGETISITIGPDILSAVVLAGLLFPLGLGALGGYLGFRRQPVTRDGS